MVPGVAKWSASIVIRCRKWFLSREKNGNRVIPIVCNFTDKPVTVKLNSKHYAGTYTDWFSGTPYVLKGDDVVTLRLGMVGADKKTDTQPARLFCSSNCESQNIIVSLPASTIQKKRIVILLKSNARFLKLSVT